MVVELNVRKPVRGSNKLDVVGGGYTLTVSIGAAAVGLDDDAEEDSWSGGRGADMVGEVEKVELCDELWQGWEKLPQLPL